MDAKISNALYLEWSKEKFKYHALVNLCGTVIDINEIIFHYTQEALISRELGFDLLVENWMYLTAPCSPSKLNQIIKEIASDHEDMPLFIESVMRVNKRHLTNARELTSKLCSSTDDYSERIHAIFNSYYKHNQTIDLLNIFDSSIVYTIPSDAHALAISGLISHRDNLHTTPSIARLVDLLYPLDATADDGSRDIKKLFASTYSDYWEKLQLLSTLVDPINYAILMPSVLENTATDSVSLPSLI